MAGGVYYIGGVAAAAIVYGQGVAVHLVARQAEYVAGGGGFVGGEIFLGDCRAKHVVGVLVDLADGCHQAYHAPCGLKEGCSAEAVLVVVVGGAAGGQHGEGGIGIGVGFNLACAPVGAG